MSQEVTNKSNTLIGKRILITAVDLEEVEYRGIASFSKNLINVLYEKGAEIWLLSSFDTKTEGRKYKSTPKSTIDLIKVSRILDFFESGGRPSLNEKLINFLVIRDYKSVLNIISKIEKLVHYILLYLRITNNIFSTKQLDKLDLSILIDNPNLRINRLDYLKKVKGIVVAKKIFQTAKILARMNSRKPVEIDVKNFDIFFCTSPLFIKPKNINKINFIQTIHDLIPLEYYKHGEDQLQFIHRLQACNNAKRIFISNTTQSKYKRYINGSNKDSKLEYIKGNESTEIIVSQPPSLNSSYSNISVENKSNLDPAFILKSYTLEPFNYLLFNSSIEPRKNPLFLLDIYRSSEFLINNNIKVCVVGHFEDKKDKYVKSVMTIMNKEDGIVFSGYVSESKKLNFYLNTLALCSPSLVEGYGLPVLDACCMGIDVLASNCESHREIQSKYDFKSYLRLISLADIDEWQNELKLLLYKIQCSDFDMDLERVKRMKRYNNYSKMINLSYEKSILDICNRD